jgi:hypothetical protein
MPNKPKYPTPQAATAPLTDAITDAVISEESKPSVIGELLSWSGVDACKFSNNSSSVYGTNIVSSSPNGGTYGTITHTGVTWHDLCVKSLYQEKVLKSVDDTSLEDVPLLLNDEDPVIRKIAELRIAANK